MSIAIRSEDARDIDAIRAVNTAAFGQTNESNLVDALRASAAPFISLVAVDTHERDHPIVGHIAFSPMTLSTDPTLALMGLAPMAVMPSQQRQGVGTALVQAGLAACRRLNIAAVFVLGHPGYYPRFGFVPAASFGIASTYKVPADAFMALELKRGVLTRLHGTASATVHYHPAFADV